MISDVPVHLKKGELPLDPSQANLIAQALVFHYSSLHVLIESSVLRKFYGFEIRFSIHAQSVQKNINKKAS